MYQDTTDLRQKLVAALRDEGLRDDSIAEAFLRVPRHVFVPDAPLDEIYADTWIPTHFRRGIPTSGSTAPSLMASTLELLRMEPGMKVLEIGTGTGYNTAILAELVGPGGSVISLEIQPAVAAAASDHLAVAGYHNTRIVVADGAYGWPDGAPYDRVLIAAVSCWTIPRPWLEQLREGGILALTLHLNFYSLVVAFRKTLRGIEHLGTYGGGATPMYGASGAAMAYPGGWPGKAREAALEWVRGGTRLLLSRTYRGPRIAVRDLRRLLDAEPGLLPLEMQPGEEYEFSRFMALHGEAYAQVLPPRHLGDLIFVRGIIDTRIPSACFVPWRRGADTLEVYGTDAMWHRRKAYLDRWVAVGRPKASQIEISVEPYAAGGTRVAVLPSLQKDGTFRFRRGDQLFTLRYTK